MDFVSSTESDSVCERFPAVGVFRFRVGERERSWVLEPIWRVTVGSRVDVSDGLARLAVRPSVIVDAAVAVY